MKAVIILLRLQMLQVAEGGKGGRGESAGEGARSILRSRLQGSSRAAGVLLRSAEADVSGSQAAARARPAFKHFRVSRVVACWLLAPSLGLCCKGILVLPPPLGRSPFSRSLFAWR